MNVQDSLALIKALKEAGATHFKSPEFGEITLVHDQSDEEIVVTEPVTSIPAKEREQTPGAPVENVEATKKVVEAINLLKMNDEQLANQIFPDGAI